MNYQNRNMKITFNQMRVGTSQLLFWLFLTQCVSASMLNLRGLKNLNEIQLPQAIPCNPGTNGTSCVCPAKCLMYSGETGGCHPMDCWSYSDIKDECNEAGKEFLPALLLQIFLGAFGSGFGNIGRWDIFGTFMSVFFGGCLFVCCCGMCCHCINKKEDQEGATALGTKCGGCLWSLAISVMWIWGIVVIANKEVKGEWTNYMGDPILCPMIG
jgi:hypothetical protein